MAGYETFRTAETDGDALLGELVAALSPRSVSGTGAGRPPGEGEGGVSELARFELPTVDWWPGRLFGGMVVAQALAAAAETVGPDLVPHSMHGYFFRPVMPASSVELAVHDVRNSRTFATREVTTYQDGRTCARMTASFTVEEEGADEYQLPPPLGTPRPEELAPVHPPGPFLSCDAGPVIDADAMVASGEGGTPVYRSSGRFWSRVCGHLPDDARLHACVLALMSDMTRASFRPGSMDRWASHTDASLDHAVWFHRPARIDDWVLFDLAAVVNTANRAAVRGALYRADGALACSMAQELLIRPLPGGGQVPPWAAAARGR
jgi:acyl-CoA thioesterase-2